MQPDPGTEGVVASVLMTRRYRKHVTDHDGSSLYVTQEHSTLNILPNIWADSDMNHVLCLSHKARARVSTQPLFRCSTQPGSWCGRVPLQRIMHAYTDAATHAGHGKKAPTLTHRQHSMLHCFPGAGDKTRPISHASQHVCARLSAPAYLSQHTQHTAHLHTAPASPPASRHSSKQHA